MWVMTFPQILSFSVLAVTMVLFAWGRTRYDLVAVSALLVSVLVGIVPPDKAFSGFSDDIVIIVASALLVSASVSRSGVLEAALSRLSPFVKTEQRQLIVLVLAVTVLSAIVKNVGALAMMIPLAFQMARRTKTPPSRFLMPMSFGSLLGGLVTLIGTSPNIVVARVRGELTGTPFGMFDFTPVGLGIAAVGVVFLVFGYRLLPADRRSAATLKEALDIQDYVTEARLAASSAMVGRTVSELQQLSENTVQVRSLVDARPVRPIRSPMQNCERATISCWRGSRTTSSVLWRRPT